MNINNTYRSRKEKIISSIILFGIMLCSPFTIFFSFNRFFKAAIILSLSLYILSNANILKYKRNLKFFVFSFLLLVMYLIIYSIEFYGSSTYLIYQLEIFIFIISIYFYIKGKNRYSFTIATFEKLILFVSIITIVASIGARTHIINFPVTELAGYSIGYNLLFGGISLDILHRPQYYFAEPSYLGFFLGFSFLYLFYFYNDTITKYRKTKLAIILIAGMLTISTTFYISFIVALSIGLINKIIKPFVRQIFVSKIIVIVFLLSSLTYITQLEKLDRLIFNNFKTSFTDRTNRIETSLTTIKNMNFSQTLFGKGTGYIIMDKNRDRGESNAYIKLYVENGLILLTIYLFVIYNFLKKQPILLLYVLVSLHSVIMLDTPFFFLIILLAKEISNDLNIEESPIYLKA